MRNKLLLIGMLLIASFSHAQNYTVAEPGMRVNRSSDISVTTSWQTISFNGTSTNNFNLYPKDPTTGNPMVYYDGSVFRVYGLYPKNMDFQLFLRTTTTIINTGATLQMRIVIPNGVSPGVDFYFPFPDDGGFQDILDVTKFTTPQQQVTTPLKIYANNALRTNGFYIQVKLSNPLLGIGTCTINSAAVVLLSRF